jgi:hypothetical protein
MVARSFPVAGAVLLLTGVPQEEQKRPPFFSSVPHDTHVDMIFPDTVYRVGAEGVRSRRSARFGMASAVCRTVVYLYRERLNPAETKGRCRDYHLSRQQPNLL